MRVKLNEAPSIPRPLSRTQRKKALTRARLLRSAYRLMSTRGIDATTISEITDEADVGFGTFYNYFETKDDIAGQVLDCVIDELGRRNDVATASLKGVDPAAVQAISIRLTMREMLGNPMWKWWMMRPELLVDRLRIGFHAFGVRDLKLAIEAGRYQIAPDEVETVWSQQMWMLAGGLKDILEANVAGLDEKTLILAIMRAMGLPASRAREIAGMEVPPARSGEIDFGFAALGDE